MLFFDFVEVTKFLRYLSVFCFSVWVSFVLVVGVRFLLGVA